MENRNFKEVYNELYSKSNYMNKLKRLKDTLMIKKMIVDVSIAVCGIIIYINTFYYDESIVSLKNCIFFILIFALVIINIQLSNKKIFSKVDYTKAYKKEIIKPLIEETNIGLRYEPLGTNIEEEYLQGKYEHHDIFFSEDCVYGNGFEMADIKAVVERPNNKGQLERQIIFNGLFSSYDLNKFFSNPIQIVIDGGFDNFQPNRFKDKDEALFYPTTHIKNKILMDSVTFEKHFDVYGIERLEVMKLLTADVMDELVRIKEKNKFDIDLKILKSKLFIRIHSGNIFEPSDDKLALDINELKDAYDLVKTVIKLAECLSKAIDETEF